MSAASTKSWAPRKRATSDTRGPSRTRRRRRRPGRARAAAARPARAGGAEQVGHGEEDRHEPEAVDDGADDRHHRVLADSTREGRVRPAGSAGPRAARPSASTTVTLSSNSLVPGWPSVVSSTPRIVSGRGDRGDRGALACRLPGEVLLGRHALRPGPTRRCAGSGAHGTRPGPARRARRVRPRATAGRRRRARGRGTARRRAGPPRCARARRAGWVWAVPRGRIVLDCGPVPMEIREVMTESVVTAPPERRCARSPS